MDSHLQQHQPVPGAVRALPAWRRLCGVVVCNLRAGARLAFLRAVTRDAFSPSADVFAALVALNLLLLFVLGVASVGLDGEFNAYEMPRALLFVPATLLFGLVAMRISGRDGSLLLFAVAVVAAGLVLSLLWGAAGLLIQHLPRRLAGGNWWQYLYYGFMAWWALVVVAAVARLASAGPGRNLAILLTGWATLVAPVMWYPQGYLWVPKYDGSAAAAAEAALWAPVEEHVFYAQQDMLRKTLAAVQPGRAGIADIYLLAAGLYAREDVFMKEVKLIAELFRRRFGADGRSVVLLISSGAGVRGASSSLAYAASKAGVHGMQYNIEAHVRGARVHVICPGGIATPLKLENIAQGAQASGQDAAKAVEQAKKQLGDPMGIARVLAFLASEDGDYVRGTIFTR